MKIFIADYLPLSNKGEEEILRGIESLFSKDNNEVINFCVFGDVQQKIQIGNVTIYPKNICYPTQKYKAKIRTIVGLLWAFLGYIGFYPYYLSFASDF